MVHKQVHIRTKLPHIPVKHLGLRRLKHDPLRGQPLQDSLHHIGPPALHVLGNSLTLNHDPLHARLLDEPLPQIHNFAWVGRPSAQGLQLSGVRVASGAELDTDLGLGGQALGLDAVDQAEPVVRGKREEATRDLDDVEVEGFAFGEVTGDGGCRVGLREDVLDPAALSHVSSCSLRGRQHEGR